MTEPFEDRYLDVLQNIEFALVSVYRDHAEMDDADALNAVEALIRVYQAELKSRASPQLRLNPIAEIAFARVKTLCDWRLGREHLTDADEEAPPKSVDEIVACLKRVRRSIETWNREGGRRGYFNFVSGFIPE